MRKNALISSRFYIQSLFCNHKIKTGLTRWLYQYSTCNSESKIPKIEFITSRYYTQSTQSTCWCCHKPINSCMTGTKESFFCSNCGSLQEVNNNFVREQTPKYGKNIVTLNSLQNYFSLFGINEQFQVNQNELTQKFRQFQSVLHPDKFSNK